MTTRHLSARGGDDAEEPRTQEEEDTAYHDAAGGAEEPTPHPQGKMVDEVVEPMQKAGAFTQGLMPPDRW